MITASRFLAKIDWVPTRPGSLTFFMFARSAEAKTSAFAPLMICCASNCDPLKLYVILTVGCAAWYCVAIVLNEAVSDAAAKTLSVVDEVVGVALVGVLLVAVLPPPPQAARSRPSASSTGRTRNGCNAGRECLIAK